MDELSQSQTDCKRYPRRNTQGSLRGTNHRRTLRKLVPLGGHVGGLWYYVLAIFSCDFRINFPAPSVLPADVSRPRIFLAIGGRAMGEIVNLRKQRKARTRADDEQRAASNRARFGRSLRERQLEKNIELKREHSLDGKRIESGDQS